MTFDVVILRRELLTSCVGSLLGVRNNELLVATGCVDGGVLFYDDPRFVGSALFFPADSNLLFYLLLSLLRSSNMLLFVSCLAILIEIDEL